MTDLTSVNAPAIGQRGLERLLAMSRETKMTASSTLFTAGYEQAKRDFRDAIYREVGIPAEDKQALEEHLRVTPQEAHARRASASAPGWWGWFK